MRLDALDVVLAQQGKHAIRVRAECAQVAQAEQAFHSPAPRIADGRVEREVVVVDAAEDSNEHEISKLQHHLHRLKLTIERVEDEAQRLQRDDSQQWFVIAGFTKNHRRVSLALRQ